ncbi:MAG: SLC13 family permease [Acidobacteriota bacterium]|nr:SLC13 family permease [Acidobacteriota bacterium]
MDQIVVFLTLGLALLLFASGKTRHDVTALIALFILILAGIIPKGQAFMGFAHPAVVTVAAVLVISRALTNSGLIDVLASWMLKAGKNLIMQIFVLTVVVAVASAFMNNVGALAILMPVALFLARKSGNPPSFILMPIAFGSLLGGMTTLIGTPPNIIIATFRGEETGSAFGMFDFSPVGAGVAAAGIVFIALVGWRLLPKRRGETSPEELFKIEDYITEVRVTKDSKLKGQAVKEIQKLTDADIKILGLIRQRRRVHAPDPEEILKTHDILILETDSEDLKTFVNKSGVKLVGGKQFRKDAVGSKDIAVAESVIRPNSPLVGYSAAGLSMRSRYGLNLLAIARQEKKMRQRIDNVIFKAGDVLLLQGRTANLNDAITAMGCLPLAERGLKIGQPRKILLGLGIFGSAIASVVASVFPVSIAFPLAAVCFMISGVLPLRDVYTSIDWPVIVLLGAMIPVGEALETTGGARLLADQVLAAGSRFPVWAVLAFVLIATMFLSDVINNAATVVLMAPISISIARSLDVSIDPFLMAVAVGGSCAFLTPIGHQSNTLVMGPGGYKFSDYWRMGLPLEILIVLIGVPLILHFWPL